MEESINRTLIATVTMLGDDTSVIDLNMYFVVDASDQYMFILVSSDT